MRIGNLDKDSVSWEKIFKVTAGDFFSIEAGKVHQIANISDKPLVAIFTCSETHLSTDPFLFDGIQYIDDNTRNLKI